MNIKVHEHYLEIQKDPINEKEINITTVKFEFDQNIDGVKKAFFTLNDNTYMVYIENDQCNIPYEVLIEKGKLELGVTVEQVENDEIIKRFNPKPVYFDTWKGSLKDQYNNSKPITPTDKEQIEQMLSNIQLGITKEGKIVTITFTNKDGSTQTETLEDGKSIEYNWQGTQLGIRQEGQSEYVYVDLKGDKGDAGAIKMLIVAELPQTGQDDTIYLVPLENPDVQGNNYAEYVYINNAWELLGKIGVHVDLTDYVKNTDYASYSKGGTIKISPNDYNLGVYNGFLYPITRTYEQYQSKLNDCAISKGTLENVITGKGLTTKSYVDGLVGDIGSVLDAINGEVI